MVIEWLLEQKRKKLKNAFINMRNFARLVSYIFHPVVFFFIMPFLVVYRQTANSTYALKWQVFTSFFVFLAIIIVLLERWRGIFTDNDFTNKKEREKFYAFIWPLGFSYMAAAFFFKGMFFPLSIIAVGIVFGMLMFMLVTPFVRASIHTAVACGFALSIGILFGQVAFLTVVWIPILVAWSRLVLTKHKLPEIIIGGALGIAITMLTFFVGKYMIMGKI